MTDEILSTTSVDTRAALTYTHTWATTIVTPLHNNNYAVMSSAFEVFSSCERQQLLQRNDITPAIN